MLIFNTIDELRTYLAKCREAGDSVGLVPTMGALHDGHLSLIGKAAYKNDRTIVSVFVNPKQFDNPDDLLNYPRTMKTDAVSAKAAGADAIFAPSAAEMYPEGFSTFVDIPDITNHLCGLSREGHFRGVLTVVSKLFNIVRPDRAYFGQKDFQQLELIRHMTRDLNLGIEIVACPTVREPDGLAMSSRNKHLSPAERKAALCLRKAALAGAKAAADGNIRANEIIKKMTKLIGSEPLAKIDYVKIVNPLTFEDIQLAGEGSLIALAVYIGETRLIDNHVL
ncbi:MAG: pantoate--beta-alanine ligase [Clostridiales Family XIII bacterium]|jgi:pantoate--beta-alanine ligase|nr:pantoate--beta-alanine ligase [Clostridiales Family XIII bacterium]